MAFSGVLRASAAQAGRRGCTQLNDEDAEDDDDDDDDNNDQG